MTPIIFVNYGNHPCIYQAVKQAKLYNDQVFVLGDSSNVNCCVNHYLYSNYSGLSNQLKTYYVYMTTDNHQINFFCTVRFLMLLEFCKERGINHFYYGDSDDIVYRSMDEVYETVIPKGYWAAIDIPKKQQPLRQCVIGHGIWTLDGLKAYCDFVFRVYRDRYRMDKLKYKWDWHQRTGTGGGISDMAILYWFVQEHSDKFRSTTKILSDGSTFDHAISTPENNVPDEYQTTKINNWNIKEVEWRDGNPYCFNKAHNRWVRFNSLHFQGGRKSLIGNYVCYQ